MMPPLYEYGMRVIAMCGRFKWPTWVDENDAQLRTIACCKARLYHDSVSCSLPEHLQSLGKPMRQASDTVKRVHSTHHVEGNLPPSTIGCGSSRLEFASFCLLETSVAAHVVSDAPVTSSLFRSHHEWCRYRIQRAGEAMQPVKSISTL